MKTSPIKFMKLSYYPNGDVTQFFGENQSLYSQFGLDGHNGIDLVRPHGESLYAIEDGVVVDVKENPLGYGKNVRFISEKKNKNGNLNEWVYGHNHENLVKVGDYVKAGQVIATMGNTGFTVSGSTPYWNINPYAGTHLHLGLREVELSTKGFSYENSPIKLRVKNYDNGYKGSIDPTPFLVETASVHYGLFRQLLTLKSLLNHLKRK